MADQPVTGATPRVHVQLQGHHRSDGAAERLRPAAQGGTAADGASQRRAADARRAAAQARRPQGAGRAGHDAAAGQGVRREEGGGLRHRRAGHRAASASTSTSSAARWPSPSGRFPTRSRPSGAVPPGRCWRSIALKPRGLVLVTGITGSGKSTALAAMINHVNQHRRVERDHDRGPDRVPASRHDVEHHPARGRQRHAVLRPRRCATCCGRTRTSSSSARSATWRRSTPRSRPPTPDTSSSPRSTPPTRPRRSTAIICVLPAVPAPGDPVAARHRAAGAWSRCGSCRVRTGRGGCRAARC